MTPAIGHNGAPGAEHLAQLRAALARVEGEALALLDSAKREERGASTQFQRHAPWLYFPSRLQKCRRDRLRLAAVEAAAGELALQKRAAQLARLGRKAVRIRAAIAAAEASP